jgi:hypothetical protein
MTTLHLTLTLENYQPVAITISRDNQALVTHAVDESGLLPGFAHGTELTAAEACWVMAAAKVLVEEWQ